MDQLGRLDGCWATDTVVVRVFVSVWSQRYVVVGKYGNYCPASCEYVSFSLIILFQGEQTG